MKISIHMITLNNGPYVWWALKSSYPAADFIAVVEGAITHDIYHNKYYHVPATDQGLSLDNTEEEIRRFITEDDPEGKVHYEQIGFVHSWKDLRNKAHSMLPKDTDMELIQDGDCLLKSKDILGAKAIFEQHTQVSQIASYHWIFIWDFRHVLICKDRRNNFMRGECFRYNPSMNFLQERKVEFGDGTRVVRTWINWKDFVKLESYQKKNCVVSDEDLLNVYHFGYVQEKERMEIQLMRKSFNSAIFREHRLELPDLRRETLVDWLKMYHKFYTHVLIDEEEYVAEFRGAYPLDGLIQGHPYFDKPEEWFRHDDLEGDPKSPFYGQKWWK